MLLSVGFRLEYFDIYPDLPFYITFQGSSALNLRTRSSLMGWDYSAILGRGTVDRNKRHLPPSYYVWLWEARQELPWNDFHCFLPV
jgi:hypothetical protein